MTTVTASPKASENSSYLGVRDDMLALVPQGVTGRALDVGCAAGATGAALKAQCVGLRVTGIERDPKLANQAAVQLDDVLTGDAMELLAELEHARSRFDLVLCGDVLEHLADPWTTLRHLRALCPTGYVVVSLPNIAHVSTIVSLLGARWPYRDRGIHDRTHLRFFARKNLPELYASAGFVEVRRRTHHRLIERPSPLNAKLEPLLMRIPVVSRLTEYQFISLLR